MTQDAKVALEYTGKGPGSILSGEYSATTRGASLQFLSQFPHEDEYLFPPKTMIECLSHQTRGNKRLAMVRLTVNPKIPDTSAILTPDTVPGAGATASSSLVEAPGASAAPPLARTPTSSRLA